MKLRSVHFVASFTAIFIMLIPSTLIAQVSFSKPDFDVRSGATTVLDFNRDGISDIAAAVDGKIIVYLSPGDGTTGPGTEFPAGKNPIVLIPGDFNEDGIADLAELGADGTITVLLGNGDGTFSAPLATVTGLARVNGSMASNDLNHDGVEDLAVSSPDGTIAVLLGRGDGTFTISSFVSGASDLRAIESADFDGDGNVDLAVLTCCSDLFETGDLQILHGHGDGTFGPLTEVGRVSGPLAVTAADLNNDGHPDLLVAFSGCHTPCRGMDIFLNRGDGTFSISSLDTVFEGPSLPAVGDFNGDGIPDLAFEEGATVHVYMGRGDGTFGPPQHYDKGPRFFPSNATLVGDFNGDGVLDLAAVNGNNTLTLLQGNGDGTFSMRLRFRTGQLPTMVASADFNGDGVPDLAVTNFEDNTVSVLLGNGDGTFQPKSDFAAGREPLVFAVGDFNGDGAPDVAVVDVFTAQVSILLNDGTGSLSMATQLPAGSQTQAIIVADFNGDGIADLAIANNNSNNVSIFLGNGDGTFAPKMDFPAGLSPAALVAADFNQDGIMDLAVANATSGSSSITVLLGNGDGSFRSGEVLPSDGIPTAVTAGDFNGDGISDLAWTTAGAFPAVPSAVVALGNGDGTFASETTMVIGGSWLSTIGVADINGDRVLDLVLIAGGLTANQSVDAAILLGNGDGTFQSPVVVPAGSGSFNARGMVTDLNGDGLPDIAVRTDVNFSPTISILLNFSH
jgi:hypothetical protein